MWKLVLEIVEEHGIVVEVVDVLPVGDVRLCLTCAAMDVETRAVATKAAVLLYLLLTTKRQWAEEEYTRQLVFAVLAP